MLDKIFSLKTRNVEHHAGAPFLKVDNLSVRYNGVMAIENISFELHGGEHIAVVGPNGAGKSTLFKAIAGVMPPAKGSVQLGGVDPSNHICIAYLPQRSQVDWDFPATVKDVVMMGRVGKLGFLKRPTAADWDLVNECMALVRMDHHADRHIEALSGGQQQRMFIAQALAQEAELLMMDEPLTGLDAPSQDEVFGILDELKRRQVTVLVATHDLSLAADRFDQVMLINHTLLSFGPPHQVFNQEALTRAYGGHLHLIETDDGMLALEDTCCDD